MSSTSLERVIRPFGAMGFNWGNVFETSVNTKGSAAKDNIAILVLKVKTSAKTTDVPGIAAMLVKLKQEHKEVDRQEDTITTTNPDDPTQQLQTKVPKSITVKDVTTGATTTWHLATPDPANPLGPLRPASTNDGTPSTYTVPPSTPPSSIQPGNNNTSPISVA